MSNINVLRENLTNQIVELETLQSVYPDELTILDHGILADINEFIDGKHDIVPQSLEYSVKVIAPEGNIDLFITLPTNYPAIKPNVYARSSLLDREQQLKLNEAVLKFINDETNTEETCIYSIILWVQDNLDDYVKKSMKKNNEHTKDKLEIINKPIIFARYWIYSHHIYSNIKRKIIMDEAKENSLSGFCLVGKPGIICIEGEIKECEYWWQKIKVMNWHKILLKLIEQENLDTGEMNNKRKFDGFHQISFITTDKHNDMGQLLKYLTEHDCQYVFKDFFGVEGKLRELTL
ncbi:hypothetical protein PV328_009943 [Microctonus aethiopoides]|uniref:RWD domain-containing protein n=1 Tax=Microctonus aethiopoides TaxID=144406 RepID=A0AA39C6V7_9HYME|nr:hypothetical protein PV328_009943 [Microctonus aethiopoides]